MTASVKEPPRAATTTGTDRRALWFALAIGLVLLLALGLRLWRLDAGLESLPPGLTHDEANHGREAMGILDGVYLYFFPLNYGSEPLYSYTAAASMVLFGRNVLALRLVNVVFGVAAIAMTYAWGARRLGKPVALLGAALMAVSFWPLASSREALRAGMLPFFMVLAVWFYWRILDTAGRDPRRLSWSVLGFIAALVATLHIYLAARVTWVLFPLFLLYLGLVDRAALRRTAGPVALGLVSTGLLAIPMAVYLSAHPEMQTRVSMLDSTLESVRAGQIGPLLANARDALLAFVWPGYGDQFLAYNIPGRPVFDALTAAFFLLGLVVCLWRWRRPAHAFVLLWFAVGILPSLVTGPTANTTRNLAALPAVYLLPAVGFVAAAEWLAGRRRPAGDGGRHGRSAARYRWALVALPALAWLAFAAWTSGRDYFVRWGQSPDVRGAYQHTLVAMLDYLAREQPGARPLVISTVWPGPVHDASIARLVAADRQSLSQDARWADARYGLVIPAAARGFAAVPLSTPPHPAFDPLLRPVDSLRLEPDDLDPGFTLHAFDPGGVSALLRDLEPPAGPAQLGEALELVGARWLNRAGPGETAEVLTAWRVLDPAAAGPADPLTGATDAVLFTHILDGGGALVAQRDSLDAPAWSWQAGDLVLQVHPVALPADLPAGSYSAVVGVYDRASGARLPVAGSAGETTLPIPALIVE